MRAVGLAGPPHLLRSIPGHIGIERTRSFQGIPAEAGGEFLAGLTAGDTRLAMMEVHYEMTTAPMTDTYPEFEAHVLDDGHRFFVGRLPAELCPNGAGFEVLWNLHPKDFDDFKMMGKLTKLPRWQQAYGKDYHFSGRTSEARPIPPVLDPFLRWSRERIDDRLNGLLLNWYDGELGHYIGPHNDEIIGLVPGAPIVGVPQSSDQERTLSPLGAPWSDGAGSPRSCDNDESRVLEPACFPAKTPGNEWEIPAITIILTGIVGRVSGAKSRPGRGVVRFNPITG